MKELVTWLVLVVAAAAPAAAQVGGASSPGFDHEKHARVFPTCVTCHEGAATPGASVWPDPATCTSCHDGTIRPRVTWQPRTEPRHTNLQFSHATHPGITKAACTSCHTGAGAPAMAVRFTVVERCLTCHQVQGPHLAADAACATCHVPLAQATRLTRADVAGLPAPPSHKAAGFGGQGHGPMARASITSCAVCHARNFCSSCHVNAPEQPAIQSLAMDARSLAIPTALTAPASHREPAFLERHGVTARKAPEQCSTCHTRESCSSCHAGTPRLIAAMPPAGPGRGAGVQLTRNMPSSHNGVAFRNGHGPQAAAMPATCTGCHVRSQCMDCHRPSAASASRGYHPAAFLERHPSAAYARETSCADCHNAQVFCTSCHVKAGLSTRTPLGAGYHDAKRFFLMGHGQAARQNLESCVSCHAERDCVSCHAAQGGRRFNPHGPGFDANRLRAKNPEMCTVCHGTSIPIRQ